VFGEAAGEVAERLVELLDGPESVQLEQLLLQGPDESLDASVALRLADEGWTRLDAEGLEFVLEGVQGELAAMVVAELRALRDLVPAPPLREVNRLAEALDGLEARAARHSPVQWSTTTKTAAFPSSVRQPVASMAHISSGVAVVIVRSWVSGPRTPVGRSQARMPCSRMILRTRRIEVRTPRSCRSRAQILRWPSPTKSVDARTARISAWILSSERHVFGPRFRGVSARCSPAPCGADGGAGEPPRPADAEDAVGLLRGG